MGPTYAIIPARSGSKGIPSKNVKQLGAHPLIAYSILAALKTPGIDRVIVSTDSPEYADIAKNYGAEAPFLRPADISGDKASDLECMLHALEFFKSNDGEIPSHLVHLRPTTPLRSPKVLSQALTGFLSSESRVQEYTALRSAHEMPETAYKCLEVDPASGCLVTVFEKNFDIEKSNVSRHLFPKTFSANGYIDILNTKTLLDRGRIHGDKVQAFITPHVTEIDTIEEFRLLEYQLAHTTNPDYSIYK